MHNRRLKEHQRFNWIHCGLRPNYILIPITHVTVGTFNHMYQYVLKHKYHELDRTKSGGISIAEDKVTAFDYAVTIKQCNTYPLHNFGKKKNIFIYDNVGIGPNSFISATNAKCIIKGNTSIAEGFTVHTGNHAQVVGKFVSDINENNKPKGFDKDVMIDKDVWIGCRVTLLSGIKIGRGAIVAAGAVVNKTMPPYTIIGGVP